MFYNCFNNNLVFASRIFHFRYNALIVALNASSMSESLATSFALEWKILQSFLFLYSKTNIIWTLNFLNSFKNYFNLFLIVGLVLITCNFGSKHSKSQYYSCVHNYQKNLIVSSQHNFLLHQALLEIYEAI